MDELTLRRLLEQLDPEQQNEFLNQLDFNYEKSRGEDLHGVIWLTDNTWIGRYPGDFGEAYWTHNVLPTIPKQCYKV